MWKRNAGRLPSLAGAPTVSPVSDWNCTRMLAVGAGSVLPFFSGGSMGPRAMVHAAYYYAADEYALDAELSLRA